MKLDIGKATISDLTNVQDTWQVAALETDGVGNQEETEYQNAKWSQYWGYFNSVADLKSAIILKAIWNVGKGYTADNRVTAILEGITGWGKDTFQDIIFNMEIIRRVGGDAYAEIIRNPKSGTLINLKPLDPGSMKIIVNRQGIIKRYEQVAKIKDRNVVTKFQPQDIFHLSNNRLADQIHGISDIESLEPVIKAEEESFADMVTINHRQAKPLIMFKLGTDDQSKIDEFIVKMDSAINKGEHIYIPDDENSVSYDVVQVNVSQLVMAWRDDIRNKFYRTIGLPQIVPGAGGKSTESESKVIYKAFEQIVHADQLFLEKQIWNQLALRIDFIHPASISPEMQADEAKDAGQQTSFQPGETKIGEST